MFDIGLLELFLVLVIGLVVLGPERLPEVIKSVTRSIEWIKKNRHIYERRNIKKHRPG